MKKIRFLISVIVVVMMLAPYSVQASGSISVTKDVFTGKVKTSVSFASYPDLPVSVEILPDGVEKNELSVSSDALTALIQNQDKIAYLKQINADSNGKAIFEFLLNKSGKYLARAHSMYNIGDAVEAEFYYITPSDGQNVWNNFVSNPSDNLSLLLEMFDVKDELILSLSDDEDLFYEIEQYPSSGEFNKINADELLKKIKASCEEIILFREIIPEVQNSTIAAEIHAIVTNDDKAAALGITEHMSRYNALANTAPADNALLGREYTNKDEFALAFVAAVEAAEEALTEKQPNRDVPKVPSGNRVGGGSLGSSVSSPSVSQSAYSFTDISNVPWAAEAITSLYNEGIINGKSKNEFAPNDNITREEFVKIALGIMGVKPVSGNVSFSDVDSFSWYAPYVNAALSAGIVSGYSDTVFGVGEFITRQDVAVILNRVHSLSNVNASIEFSDNNDISDYAKSAVASLSAVGVINGSDGRFMPKSNCTRAEAACMVYRMMSLMKEGK